MSVLVSHTRSWILTVGHGGRNHQVWQAIDAKKHEPLVFDQGRICTQRQAGNNRDILFFVFARPGRTSESLR